MKVTGQCFCGDVTYKAIIDPEKVVVCHCTDCQSHAGTAFGVVVAVIDNQFDVLTGGLKSISKISERGVKRDLTFCPQCGTRIYAKSPDNKNDFFGIRFGTLDQKHQLTPKFQVFCKSAQPWAIIDSIPQFETLPS